MHHLRQVGMLGGQRWAAVPQEVGDADDGPAAGGQQAAPPRRLPERRACVCSEVVWPVHLRSSVSPVIRAVQSKQCCDANVTRCGMSPATTKVMRQPHLHGDALLRQCNVNGELRILRCMLQGVPAAYVSGLLYVAVMCSWKCHVGTPARLGSGFEEGRKLRQLRQLEYTVSTVEERTGCP
jgi:hypothetical protein